MSIPTPLGSNMRPLRGRDLFLGDSYRRFHLRLMIFLPFGEARNWPSTPRPSANFLHAMTQRLPRQQGTPRDQTLGGAREP